MSRISVQVSPCSIADAFVPGKLVEDIAVAFVSERPVEKVGGGVDGQPSQSGVAGARSIAAALATEKGSSSCRSHRRGGEACADALPWMGGTVPSPG